MTHRQPIELVPVEWPLRQVLVQQRHEVGVVRRLQEVEHFVHDDIGEAFAGLLGKFGVEARIVRALWLQLPQWVFMRCTKNRATCTPSSGSHLAINGGTACLSCWRYQASMRACLFCVSAPGRTRRSM